MGGKAVLYVVIGFSLILMTKENNMNKASVRSVANMVEYNSNLNAHNIAVGGANLAANQIFLDPTWTAGYNNIAFSGGKINVSVSVIDQIKNIRRVTSIGTYNYFSDTVQITLQPSKFSKFAYYSTSEGGTIYWVTGDTVWGPLHTQDYINVSGSPVFYGKVSTKLGMRSNGYWIGPWWNRKLVTNADPKFYGGYQQGVDLSLPPANISNLENSALKGGYDFTGHDTVYVTFAGDSLKYKYTYNSIPTTVYSKTFAPNGVIFASNAVLRIKGTVKGLYSIGASGSTGTMGNVYIDDDIVYDTNPRTNPNSTDMLGIVANNNVFITNNAANNKDINIDASIYCSNGGFGAQNYDTRPVSGNINLLGGIQQHTRLPVGTFSGGDIYSGFNKKYKYDDRLMYSSPPDYPNTGSFEIVAWYE